MTTFFYYIRSVLLRNIEKKYPMILCKVSRDTLQSNT